MQQIVDLSDRDRSLFPSSFTIRALRDSRYHNSAYAVAELIDNSIEARAERIDLLCQEEHVHVGGQLRLRLTEIAVLDNGEGMDAVTLMDALKFGGGTRHSAMRGIGKYGMGLPTSSMSQCKRVDVWTWQGGSDAVFHSMIDAEQIEQGNHFVPIPDDRTPIPERWARSGGEEIFSGESGTLVVWSKLDKIQWKTGRALIDNTATEVGRIHRHHIEADAVRVRALSFLKNRPDEPTNDKKFVANDPLYLMFPSSTPDAPWNREPMFTQWGETKHYTVTVGGREETINVRYSIVKPEALKTEHAAQNPGRYASWKAC